VEKKYVYEIYEKIAPHFSSTRYKPWPKIESFLKSLEPGSLVADVGCGNGKYLGSNPDIEMVGTDRSENLLKICKEKSESY
jgi:ubiquinone/menaquinone biosynthesis C-methylase UbiE